MSEEEAIKRIKEFKIKAFSKTTGKAKPIFLEVDYIFQDSLFEFKKLLNVSKHKKGKLYQQYKELSVLKNLALKYSGIKGTEYLNEERPPITIITFNLDDLEDKLKEFNNEIKEFKNESNRI